VFAVSAFRRVHAVLTATIGRRIAFGFGAVILLLLAAIAVGMTGLRMQRAAETRLTDSAAIVQGAMQLKFRAADVSGWQVAYALDIEHGVPRAATAQGDMRKGFLDSMTAYRAEAQAMLTGLPLAADERAVVRKVLTDLEAYAAIDRRAMALYAAGGPENWRRGAAVINGPGTDAFYELAEGADRLVATASARSAARTADATAQAGRLAWVMIGFGVAACALALVLAMLLTRSLVRSVRMVRDRMFEIARGGDLMSRIEVRRADELGELSVAFNKLMATFHDIVREVGEQARSLNETAQGLARSADESRAAVAGVVATVAGVADGSEEQVRHGHDLAGTVDEIAGRVAEVDRAGVAADAAAEAADAAARTGAQALARAQEGMARIRTAAGDSSHRVGGLAEHSDRIGTMVGEIHGVAAQTHLLALNASIEAARAGESGRGFAVVAGEVQSLADQATRAADGIAGIVEEIRGQIGEVVRATEASGTEVADGAARVAEADEAFRTVLEQVDLVGGNVHVLRAAGQALTDGVERVTSGVGSVSGLSERNSAAAREVAESSRQTVSDVEDVAAASSRVATAAGELRDLVSAFRVWSPGTPDRRRARRDTQGQGPQPAG
jgi:methyl-accepting chemotaxis protein